MRRRCRLLRRGPRLGGALRSHTVQNNQYADVSVIDVEVEMTR